MDEDRFEKRHEVREGRQIARPHGPPRRALATCFLWLFLTVLLGGARTAMAYSSPLADVQAWLTGRPLSTIVNASVYDPSRGRTQTMTRGPDNVMGLTNVDGVVAWETGTTYPMFVHCAVYDPGPGTWQVWTSAAERVIGMINEDGILAWETGGTYPQIVHAATYDPSRAGWQTYTSPVSTIIGLLNQEGIVAWETGGTYPQIANGVVYDPSRGSWRAGYAGPFAPLQYMSIADASIVYSASYINYTLGYDAAAGTWRNGRTATFAHFVPAATTGNPPLGIWFTDMSIAATRWSYAFGDGGASAERGPFHTFSGTGVFTVTQSVSGTGGSDSATATIRTDMTGPTGAVIVNGGATTTASTSVVLTLSATDGSGTVASMRLGNASGAWEPWEPFRTSKSWTLISGDGLKTVYAQFMDAAGNVSAVCSDSILLQTAPATPSSPADHDGDGRDDIGVFRNGMWFVSFSPDFSGVDLTTAFGSPQPGADRPEMGEFGCAVDGYADGQGDFVTLRKRTSTWQATLSPTWGSAPDKVLTFGTTSHKRIATRHLDTNGDGCSDIGVFKNGCFDVLESPDFRSPPLHVCFGLGTDEPLAGDLNGDGSADLILWRPSTAHFSYRLSPDYSTDRGADVGGGQYPLVGDMNDDGRIDLGSYDSRDSTFRFTYSPDFIGTDLRKTYGMSGDVPILADVNGDGASDLGIFRPTNAAWSFKCSPNWSTACVSKTFGRPGDLPIYGKPAGMP